jgi:hypothetical protein
MKRYATFVHLINWLAVLAAAIWLTYHGATRWLNGGEPNALPIAQTIGGLILLLLNLLLAILRILSTRTVTYLIFEKEGAGSLKVSVDAIEEVLTKCALAVPEITRATVKLQLEKGGKMPTRATAHCVFIDVPNLFAAQDSARQTISSRYQDIFPGEQLQIEVVVDRFQSESARPKPPRKKRGEEEKEEDFGGPRYPIGG